MKTCPELALDNAEDPQPIKQTTASHLIDFEGLQAEPDQLLSYYLWVVDIGPDGEPRRTMSDMYFAEVRHFEEIFREASQAASQQAQQQQQQQQGQQQGAGQQVQELVELQKQVINATWKLIRRETADEPSVAFGSDAETLQLSQQQAIDQLAAAVQQLQDPDSQTHAEQAAQFMNTALEQLTTAVDDVAVESLRPALSAEQGAYQALLKLRARELDVAQANQQQGASSGSASGAGNRSQQQLQQA